MSSRLERTEAMAFCSGSGGNKNGNDFKVEPASSPKVVPVDCDFKYSTFFLKDKTKISYQS